MSGRIGVGTRTHAFVAYEVIVSIVRANRYRPVEEGRIPGKGSKANLPHWAPRMTSIAIVCEIEIACHRCRNCGLKRKKRRCAKILSWKRFQAKVGRLSHQLSNPIIELQSLGIHLRVRAFKTYVLAPGDRNVRKSKKSATPVDAKSFVLSFHVYFIRCSRAWQKP